MPHMEYNDMKANEQSTLKNEFYPVAVVFPLKIKILIKTLKGMHAALKADLFPISFPNLP